MKYQLWVLQSLPSPLLQIVFLSFLFPYLPVSGSNNPAIAPNRVLYLSTIKSFSSVYLRICIYDTSMRFSRSTAPACCTIPYVTGRDRGQSPNVKSAAFVQIAFPITERKFKLLRRCTQPKICVLSRSLLKTLLNRPGL